MSARKGIVTTDILNVRTGPGTDFSILAQLIRETQVDIVSQLGDWIELNLSSLNGYLHRAYVVLASPGSGGNNGINYGIVEAETLNIRSGPGYEFQTIATAHQGDMVEITEEHPEWFRIKTRHLKGFILKDLLVEIIGGGSVTEGLYLAAVNEELVNLRSGPGLNYPVIAVLAEDTEVKVQQIMNGWVEVETIQYEGFIRKDFVKKSSPEGIPAEDSDTITTATVTTNRLSLRSGPGENYPPLAFLNSGIQVKVKDMASDWLRVQLMTKSAYVFGKYINYISPTVPGEMPSIPDPLKPTISEIIIIEDHFSVAQKTMANTWNQYGGLVKQISSQFSIDPIVALAVLAVESGGKGFGSDGRLIIRFENHYFYHYWGATHEDQYNRHFKFDPNTTWQGHEYRISTSSPWQPVHTGQQSDEWQVFEFGSQFDRDAALKSISMGSPQIMGANYHLIGYSSGEQMFLEFQADVRNQILGLFRFIQAKDLIPDLISQDFIAFAQVYNGPAQASTYGNKIKQYVDEFRSISPFA